MRHNSGIKSALESMLFTWGQPLDISTAAEVIGREKDEVKQAMEELKEEYDTEERGIRIRRVESSYQLVTSPENGDYIRKLCTPTRKRRLSQSALEVLAIIAYSQPVTRGEIESVRGIKCDRVVEGLMKKNLICEKGRSDSIGRPILYGTTEEFLEYMNIESIESLPGLEEYGEEEEKKSVKFEQMYFEF